jgi:creatinine amidohydrolase
MASETKIHYLDLLPHEFRARIAEHPIGYLPLGTLEWHGEQNPLGSDAIISMGLFERAARRFGGIVFPPLFLGPDRLQLQRDGSALIGMDIATVTTPNRQLDGSCYRCSEGLYSMMVETVLSQARRAGFKVIVADGHGPSRWSFGRQADGWEKEFGIRLVCVDRDFKEKGWKSQVDHAARNETSLVMALRPELVDLKKLSSDRSVWPQGVGGEDPRDSTAKHGEECISICLSLLESKLKELGV